MLKYIVIWVTFLALIVIAFPLWLNLNYSDRPDVYSSQTSIDVYFASEDKTETMNFEDYITGVVMAEMPASFEIEALKAQAVAARTYTIEKIKSAKKNAFHKGADICTDFSHCQAFVSNNDAKTKWGKDYNKYLKKCQDAVNETIGMVAMYENKPIKAVFHAFAGGKTENASDVWGTDVSYLKSVESPGDKSAPKFKTEKELSLEEFKNILKSETDVDFSENIVGKITYTEGGAVANAELGNKTFKGTKIRQLFSLRSACFEIENRGDSILFRVKGYGHGVGMSQYGANYYAKKGLKYDEILKKYYSGIDVVRIDKPLE